MKVKCMNLFYLCRSFICFHECLVVELPPGEDVTPVAQVISTVGEAIPFGRERKQRGGGRGKE